MRRAAATALAMVLLVAPAAPASAEGYEVQSDRDWCGSLMFSMLRDFEQAGFVEPGFSDLLTIKCTVRLRDQAFLAGEEDGVGWVPASFLEMAAVSPYEPPPPPPPTPVPTPTPEEAVVSMGCDELVEVMDTRIGRPRTAAILEHRERCTE